MVQLTLSLRTWLSKFHPDILPLVEMWHVELMTNELVIEYVNWCKTDEGRQYLKGGSLYRED